MPTGDRSAVEQALAAFLDAFNHLDRERVEACFADDATVFDAYGGKRRVGFWHERFDAWRASRPGPPYRHLQPRDLLVQSLGAVAVATFHLDHHPDTLGRRTLVLTRTQDGWKIAHLHASNMPREIGAEPPAPPRRQ
jgi:ketosteroid isomerase-like protein